MTKTIVVQKVTSKQGTTKSGKAYTKYGVQDANGDWYNSFQPINAKEGGEYQIEFKVGQFGNDLENISPVSETENQTANKNRNNSIVRQHSQEMALMYLQAQGKPFSLDDVHEMTDWFVADVEDQEMPFKENGSKTETEEEVDISEIPF